jgi:UDP-N-acetylglucosamine transferase subunit ALG13
MIFVTTGTQDPFDRLMRTIDQAFPYLNGVEIIAQVAKSEYEVKNFKTYEFLSPIEFEDYFNRADLIIAHAGMGTIISALVKGKPILVMPRLVKFGEQRNDHQLATARRMDQLGYINVAYDEKELIKKLRLLSANPLNSLLTIDEHASKELIDSLSNFISFKKTQ